MATGIGLIWVGLYEDTRTQTTDLYPPISDRMFRCLNEFSLAPDSATSEILSDFVKAWIDPQQTWPAEPIDEATAQTAMDEACSRRKFWQMFTVQGGKLDEQGVSIGWKISKGAFRAMMESAQGLDPDDMSEAAKAKRVLRGLSDLHGISFIAKIKIEPSNNPSYGDSNRLDRVVLPNEPEWKKVMNGEAMPPAPSHRPARPAPAAKPVPQPAWNQPATKQPAGQAQAPAWASAPPQQQQSASQPASAKAAGPAWLNT